MIPPSSAFIGIQLASESRHNRDLSALCADIKNLAPVNTLVCFTSESELRKGSDATGGTRFSHPPATLDASGRDAFDLLHDAASAHGMSIYLAGGESPWVDFKGDFPHFAVSAQVDCFGNRTRLSCVNHPEWRNFQFSHHASVMREHPYVAGFMFMHERAGPFQQLTYPDPWQGEFTPGCFCERCRELGRARGIDPDRAAEGMRRLVTIFRDRRPADIRDGIFIAFFRTATEYPEILAWERLQWDSLHRYRADFSAAVRAARPGAKIGYHFQHAGSTGNIAWRAGDDPTRAVAYADWVKHSVYPGVSGQRYANALRRARETWLGDCTEDTAHQIVSSWFGRPDAAEGRASLGHAHEKTAPQSTFSAAWVEAEVRRITEGAAPLPHYAGLGIGVPGGENADTVDSIRACTEACFRGGASGILLSRHHHEMRPELLQAAGDVIRAHYGL